MGELGPYARALPPRRARRPRRRRGYVLLSVLAALIVAALALTSLARRSLALATTAVRRQEQLQLHWGALSCQRTLLPSAQKLFEELDKLDEQPHGEGFRPRQNVETTVVLGGMRMHLNLSDESTKVSLNSLYHHGRLQRVERFVRQATAASAALPVRLRPQADRVDPAQALADETEVSLPPAFRSWGQVFDLGRAQAERGGVAALPGLTRTMTCWGNGRLNVRRATDETMMDVCGLVVSDGQARQIARSYRDNMKQSIARVVEQAISADESSKRELLSDLLRTHSSCYSLWVAASSGRLQWQRLVISEKDDEEQVTHTYVMQF